MGGLIVQEPLYDSVTGVGLNIFIQLTGVFKVNQTYPRNKQCRLWTTIASLLPSVLLYFQFHAPRAEVPGDAGQGAVPEEKERDVWHVVYGTLPLIHC